MFSLAVVSVTPVAAAPPPAPAPAPAAGPAVPALAVDAPAPAAAADLAAPTTFGVRWRIAIPGAAKFVQASLTPIMRRGEAIVVAGDTITALDLANGKRKRGARSPYKMLVGGDGGLVATNVTEELGIDPTRFTPTWHAPVPHSLFVVGDWIVETPRHSLRKQAVRLRRVRDGQVMWELDDEINVSPTAKRIIEGPTMYLQLTKSVAAIEIATGKLRWRRPGTLQSVSEGHVAISTAPRQVVITDGDGRDQWTARCESIVLNGRTAYATTGKAVTAIDLATNRVRWRRADVRAFASDATWVYARASETEDAALVVLAADTGAIAGQIPQSRTGAFAVAGDGTALVIDGKWAFALGALAKPAPARELTANVCMIVHGCRTNTAPLVGGKVAIDGITGVTDRRGCFRWQGKAGLAPLTLTVSGGDVVGQPAVYDLPFPDTVVMDSAAVTVYAEFQGSGCDDHTHTGVSFP